MGDVLGRHHPRLEVLDRLEGQRGGFASTAPAAAAALDRRRAGCCGCCSDGDVAFHDEDGDSIIKMLL